MGRPRGGQRVGSVPNGVSLAIDAGDLQGPAGGNAIGLKGSVGIAPEGARAVRSEA